jgi:FkbM family methyltransferase
MLQVLDINQKQNTQYAIPLWLRDEQIKSALARPNLGRIEPVTELRGEPCAVVGYGPSLKQTWEQIKAYKWVFSCSGAHRLLIDSGIIPTWHVAVDPLPKFTVSLIGEPHTEVTYLIASTCHPDVFDHLAGYNVKLWHVFAEPNVVPVLPRGEWSITGGCDVGLRTMTLARFFGFTELHIFGLDGSSPTQTEGRHGGPHPNKLQSKCETEYKGRKFFTTPGMLEAAKGVFHELNQMPDVTAKFYGEGLIQTMARDYVRAPSSGGGLIAFNQPALISEEMRALNARLHKDNLMYGVGGSKYAEVVLNLCKEMQTNSVLDYGAGKQQLAKSLPFPIWSYDPAIPEIAAPPRPADIVICTDVLEHVEPDKILYVLDDLKRCLLKAGYFVIHKGPAVKTYADGQNAHLLQRNRDWWLKTVGKFFAVGQVIEKGKELHLVVGVKTAKEEAVTRVEHEGTVAKFSTPNDTTKWRAETLLTKEPCTTEWIDTFKPGEVFYDVGANVGGYSVWAAKRRGVQPYAFEPQADNYALLVKNLQLNQLEPNAYCLALTDKAAISKLYLSGSEPGGSCNTFEQPVDYSLRPRTTKVYHGAVGFTIDELVARGLPAPNHLKIDVDGFEFRVVRGAEHTLSNGAMKSLLVEVNPALPEHRAMVAYLGTLGYSYDSAQVERATRQSGPFKGVAEHVFTRTPPELTQLLATIRKTTVIETPFPHLYVADVLTNYSELMAGLPRKWTPIKKVRGVDYPKRFVAPEPGFSATLRSGALKQLLCEKFNVDPAGLTDETLLIRDKPGYSIGPHTDHPDKVISALFYLEGCEGTSLYAPRKVGFTCAGGPHYSFSKFKRVLTIPFQPNSLFVFLKSDHSFHGVETTKHQRTVLLYDVRRSHG